MRSRWSDADATNLVDRYARDGVNEDLALRVYTSRLLGADPRLVQHGGGNTSVKTILKDALGRNVDVLCVKGSGWDMEFIEPRGLPPLRLQHLLDLRSARDLTDDQMVNEQRCALLSASSPNPSVETLLHAWIPQKFIDHTHANAILALTDQADGDALVRDLFGERVSIAPYCMPGFQLAHLAAQTYEKAPDTDGMILLKHGLFTWGGTARQAYERMIDLVDIAERKLGPAPKPKPRPANVDGRAIAPALRGALHRAWGRNVVLDLRDASAVRDYVDSPDVVRFSQVGVATPDHVIRTRPWPAILDVRGTDAAKLPAKADATIADFAARYRSYFERNNAASPSKKIPLDPWPRVVLVPGLGLYAVGTNRKEASVAADIAETTVDVVSAAERMSSFRSIGEQDIFEMEHWSLEQAKLGKSADKALAGSIVAISGGGGVIGGATARAFAAQGAEIALLDSNMDRARTAGKAVNGEAIACDVADRSSVDAAFDRVVQIFGGLDILVSNAGAAWSGRIGEVEEDTLRKSFELNFYGHQRCAQAAVRIFREQGYGGCLLFNISKQALNPGPDFGPYGAPKAAALFLAKQYALDYGAEGIRSNAVNADRIRSGLLTDSMIAARASARGVTEKDYMAGNLLRQEVTADDVASAFVSLALAKKTTGAILTVDGGNMAASPR
jgi:rhamnose utilization protein RhaD (predicted bifunctional aldolase and dehydrogenase)/NAD(P)-dependent dehydrogenase (short-subunit alcohol dehydrogenase family)